MNSFEIKSKHRALAASGPDVADVARKNPELFRENLGIEIGAADLADLFVGELAQTHAAGAARTLRTPEGLFDQLKVERADAERVWARLDGALALRNGAELRHVGGPDSEDLAPIELERRVALGRHVAHPVPAQRALDKARLGLEDLQIGQRMRRHRGGVLM